MTYHRYLSTDGSNTAAGIKVAKNYQEILSLLQVAIGTGGKVIDTLNKLTDFIGRIDASENSGSHKDMINQWLMQIERLVTGTKFRGQTILDGSSGIKGEASDPRIQMIRCGNSTQIEKEKLLSVKVHRQATHAFCHSTVPLSDRLIESESYLYFNYKNKHYEFAVKGMTSVEEFMNHLEQFIMYSGLDLGLGMNNQNILTVYYRQPGKANHFSMLSATTNLFSDGKGNYLESTDGEDIIADVDNKPAIGIGNFIVAFNQKSYADGLILNIAGAVERPGETLGYVKLYDQSWTHKDRHGNLFKLVIPSFKPDDLGKGLYNESGFKKLSDIKPDTPKNRADSLNMTQWIKQDVSHTIDNLMKLETVVKALCLKELQTTLNQFQPEAERIKERYKAENIVSGMYHTRSQNNRLQIFT